MQGIGVYSIQNTYYYEGSFNNNKPHGYGLFSSESGQSYEGNFIMGNIEGKGVMIYLDDGRRLESLFKENVYNEES